MDIPLIVALVTFLAIFLGSSAVFLYLNSREAMQTWRRRADGEPCCRTEVDSMQEWSIRLRTQLVSLLEWFGQMNQPSNM